MYTAYKINTNRRVAGKPSEIKMTIYEGEISTLDEYDDLTEQMVSVTRFRYKTPPLRTVTLFIEEVRSNDMLRDNCDVELNKDETRTSVDKQKRTVIRG